MSFFSLSTPRRFFAETTSEPSRFLGLVLTVLLAILILVPLGQLIHETLVVQSYDKAFLPDAEVGSFTLFHLERVFGSKLSWALFYKPFRNSLIVAFTVTAISVCIGGFFSWLIVRTNVPFREALNTTLVIPYMMPSWVLALAWIAVFKNDRIAGAQGVFTYILGAQPPDWLAYGMVPIIICLSLHYYVYSYLVISGALTSVDTQLEEAGAVAGLSRLRQMVMITAPLLLPAIGSAVVMTFIRVIGSFGAPALLGMPVRFFVMPTQIYVALGTRNAGDGYLLALVLVVLAITFIMINSRMIGVRKSFVTLSGKGFRRRDMDLGGWRWPIFAIAAAFLFSALALPLGLLLWDSLMLEPGVYSFDNLTLHYWLGDNSESYVSPEPGILLSDKIGNAAWNSIRLALCAAVVAGLAGVLIGYVVVRTRGATISKVLETMAFAPYIFPAVAFGAIYLGMFSSQIGPIPALYGTFILLVLISSVKALPFTSRTGISALLQIDKSLEEAARVQGIGWYKRMIRIIIPLASSGLISGMLLTFITVMRELSLIILLVTPSTAVLTTLIFEYQLMDLSQHVGAATVLLVLIVISVNLFVRLISRKSQIQGF
ncbi:MAG: iron ABC transporter permease [Rhodospirillales bacterium]|nr:iron ABC transporter permease [Rhodospirillales bacterium]